MSGVDHERVERRLWEHILRLVYGTTDLQHVKAHHRDPEGHAFFEAIDLAFTSTGGDWFQVIDRDLVAYIASWARKVASGNDEIGGPVGPKSNHCVSRAMGALIRTLRRAIQKNQLRDYDGRKMYGCLEIPQWFIDTYMDELRAEAEHLNEMCNRNPDIRSAVSSMV